MAANGTLVGGNFLIAGESENERLPRLAAGGSSGTLVLWDRDNGSGSPGRDLYGRYLDGDGQLRGGPFTILQDAGQQTNPAAAGDGAGQVFVSWQDDRNGNWDVYGALLRPELDVTVIEYDYDDLYRLTGASYTGAISATYEYDHDPVGNRTAFTQTITATKVITYEYDHANRLVESAVIGGDVTTYAWDDAGRLITTTVGSQVSRVYQYNQNGELISADVEGLVTTFVYDGDGRRLLMSVAGDVTTYTLDYGGSSSRVLWEQGPEQDKVYLYGLQCIAEQVEDKATSETEWRYYQRDGNHMVRQTTDSAAGVTLAWTYTREGAVLAGEEGPLTLLDCGNGAIYDWSTGLIFKNGRYFDPTTGIWLALTPLIIWQARRPPSRKQRRSRDVRPLATVILLSLFLLALSGCGGEEALDWQEVGEEIICSPDLPDDLQIPVPRNSEKVNIGHVAGPIVDPSAHGDASKVSISWRVEFTLENPARENGWIVQEINNHSEVIHPVEGTKPSSVRYWEAWPVRKGSTEARTGLSYDDEYYLEVERGTTGFDDVVGLAKFYEGNLPPLFGYGEVSHAGDLVSSYRPPPFWDYTGTAHNWRIEWDTDVMSGTFNRGNQQYRWSQDIPTG